MAARRPSPTRSLQHAGDARTVRDAYAALTADQQSQIQEFLLTLGRREDVDAAAPPVDLSGFSIEQEQAVGGSETFAAFDFQGVFLAGRSFPEAAVGQQTLPRTHCGNAAPLAAS